MIVTLQHTLSSPFFSVIHWHLPWLLQDKSKFIYMMTNYLPQFSLLSGFHLWLEQKVGECEFWSLTGLQSQSWFLFLYAFHTHCANTRINSLVWNSFFKNLSTWQNMLLHSLLTFSQWQNIKSCSTSPLVGRCDPDISSVPFPHQPDFSSASSLLQSLPLLLLLYHSLNLVMINCTFVILKNWKWLNILEDWLILKSTQMQLQ